MAETLRQKQSRFARMLPRLIDHAYDLGYEITFGECYRTPEQAKWNAERGLGIANSLHTDRLAIDLNLFRDGVMLTTVEAFEILGAYWESFDEDHAWGGRFSKPDPYHFSIAHGGRK